MFRIICETPFRQSVWCEEILSGLLSALKKRRKKYTEIQSESGLMKKDTLFVLGTNPVWLNNIVCYANSLGVTPVLFAPRTQQINGKYHSVYTDLNCLMEHLIQCFPGNVALYGVNPDSVSDTVRLEGFNRFSPDAPVFYNLGSLDRCFASFVPYIDNVNTVICVNGLAATSLAQKLNASFPEISDKITIISCTKNFENAELSKQIISIDTQYDTLGQAALLIADACRNQNNISCMTITQSYKTDIFPSTQTASVLKTEAPSFPFYQDDEMMNLLKIDNLLKHCDELDIQILRLVLDGKNYAEISEKCFISESSVKYRAKKFLEITGKVSKQELVKSLKEYYK